LVKVEFLGPIGLPPKEFDVSSLSQLSQALKLELPQIEKWLENCAVAVNDKMVSDRDTALKSGDKVTLLPPVCGG